MDTQLQERINEIEVLSRKVVKEVKNKAPFPLFSHELRKLTDTLRYLVDVDINAFPHSEPDFKPFWQQFSDSLTDCKETLQTLSDALADVAILKNEKREARLQEIGELRQRITPFAKTFNIALQIITMFVPRVIHMLIGYLVPPKLRATREIFLPHYTN